MKPEFKYLLLTLSALVVSNASAANDIVDRLGICARESNDATRLTCYDKLAADNDNRGINASSSTTQQLPGNANAQQTPELSATKPRKSDAPAAKEITSKVVKIEKQSFGRLVFTLENSQVWQQVEAKDFRLLHAGDIVKIKRGAFGSHILVTPSNHTTSVELRR